MYKLYLSLITFGQPMPNGSIQFGVEDTFLWGDAEHALKGHNERITAKMNSGAIVGFNKIRDVSAELLEDGLSITALSSKG